MLYRPERLLIMGFVVYLALYLVAPVAPLVSLSAGSVIYIALGVLAFAAGSLCATAFRSNRQIRWVTAKQVEGTITILFWSFLLIGLLGNLLRLADKYILRGAGTANVLDAREILMDTATSSWGLVGAALYPFGYLPLFILLGARHLKHGPVRYVLAAFVFFIPVVDSLILLSRSSLLTNVSMIYFAICLLYFGGRATPRQIALPLITILLALIAASGIIFQQRLELMGFDPTASIFISAYAFTIVPSEAGMETIQSGGLTGQIVLLVMPLVQYFLHSLFEFQLLWDGHQGLFSFGTQHFSPYVKLLEVFDLAAEIDPELLYPRVGIFTSFFGPLWVDFGWFGPAVMALFGFASRRLAEMVRRGDMGALPLYSHICVILFFAPVVNFAISAQGMYLINAFVLFWLVTRPLARWTALPG